MKKTLAELADLVGGEVVGDPGTEVHGISSLELAGPGEITFLSHPRYAPKLKASKAGAVIVPSRELGDKRPLLVVANPYLAYAKIASLFHAVKVPHKGLAPEAFIHPEARLGRDVNVCPQVWVGRGAQVGDRVTLFPGVYVGEDCKIGEESVLYPGVVLYAGCQLGRRVIVHAGSVIGSDGFGYAREGERYIKIPQLGIVRLDDDVEIGANNTIDRASFGETWIQKGVKTDNLVHVGHNVVIGEDTVVVAQVGIAGSVEVGRGVVLAGQVGVTGHLRIGDRAMVGPKSGVAKDIPPGAVVSGIPTMSHRTWLRNTQVIPRLPELLKRLRALEKKLEAWEAQVSPREGE